MSKQTKLKELTGPLTLLTWCTYDLDQLTGLIDRLGYVVEDSIIIEGDKVDALALYWGLGASSIKQIVRSSSPSSPLLLRIVEYKQSDQDTYGHGIGITSMDLKLAGSISKFTTSAILEKEVVDPLSENPDIQVHISSDEYVEEVDFYTKVLGKKAELIDEDIAIHLSTSTTDRIVINRLEGEEESEQASVVSRFPYEGWVMTSYETSDLGEILARAHAAQVKVYRTPRKILDPILGPILGMSLLSPTGMVVEVYQKSKE